MYRMAKADLNFLKLVKAHIPKQYKESKLQIQQYNPLLTGLLGTGHEVYIEYRKAYQLLFRHWITCISQLNVGYGNDKVGPMAT